MQRRKLLILLGSICLILALASLPFIGACPSPAPPEEETPTSAPAPAGEVIELKFADYLPVSAVLAYRCYEPWGYSIELLTNNRVKFLYFHGGTLAPATDAYDIAASGVADISWANLSYTPGRFPKTEVWALPFMCGETNLRNSLAAWKMYPEYLADEFENDVKVIFLAVPTSTDLYTVDKQVKTIDDLKGLKISVHPTMARALELLGATPVSLSVPELYEALQRGTIDGCFTDDMMAGGFKLYEICKYKTTMAFYSNPCIHVMNWDSYNSLPDDIKTIIDEQSGLVYGFSQGVTGDFGCERAKMLLQKKGMEFYELPQSEREKAISMVQPAIDKWISDMEAKGLPGQELVDEARKCLEEFKDVDKAVWCNTE